MQDLVMNVKSLKKMISLNHTITLVIVGGVEVLSNQESVGTTKKYSESSIMYSKQEIANLPIMQTFCQRENNGDHRNGNPLSLLRY